MTKPRTRARASPASKLEADTPGARTISADRTRIIAFNMVLELNWKLKAEKRSMIQTHVNAQWRRVGNKQTKTNHSRNPVLPT